MSENDHFYIDYSPFEQVINTLKVLRIEDYQTSKDIKELLGEDYRSEVRKRLVILGISDSIENGTKFRLTSVGQKVQELVYYDTNLVPDIMHFLHLSYKPKDISSGKMLWSYRKCCELTWKKGELYNYKELSSIIQGIMKEEFSHLDFEGNQGSRFDDTAVGRWFSWVKNLNPTPFDDDHSRIVKREVVSYKLILLAIDDYYRNRQMRYGDPFVLNDESLDAIASVFFLQEDCARRLISMAVKFSSILTSGDSFAGQRLTLHEPYGIERL